jgi:hypothetical protein
MKKLAVLFTLVLSINSSLKAQDSLLVTKDKAIVYIVLNGLYRNFTHFDFYNNDRYIGDINAYSYIKCECSSGKQIFWVAADNNDFLTLNLTPNKLYIIEAEYKFGYFKGRQKLHLVENNSEDYNYYLNKIQSSKPAQFTTEKLLVKNQRQKQFISSSLEVYNLKTQMQISLKNDTVESTPFKPKNSNQDVVLSSPIIFDYNFVDLPFSNKSMELSSIKGLITNPSMDQSLNITTSVNSLTRELLYRSMAKKASIKRYYIPTVYLVDYITFLPLPLTSGWLHEEFHRAILAKHGGNSYNEMNDAPISKALISVLDVKDEDLIRLKSESPQDMVRMSEAGIEAEYLMANNINKMAFYYNRKSISITPILNALNSALYVVMCSSKNIDKETISANNIEGADVKKRDLVGLDFLSYTYDLFRPNEPYQNRGIHPSGIGIDRYIKRSQMTTDELSYLRQQGFLQLLNLLNPISCMYTSFTLSKNKNGDDTRANLYLNHILTSFGYDISTTALLHHDMNNYALTLHNYANHERWMPGVELETYNYQFGKTILKKPIPVTARAMIWVQPEDQLFFSKKGKVGGLLEVKVHYPVSPYIQPYFTVTTKTNGWVAGNVYLESNFSASFGLRTYF